jgi:hypothetical protein
VKRLLQTSAGWIEIHVSQEIKSAGGINVGVVRFDADGWEAAEGWWNRNLEDERGSLPHVIEQTAKIPAEEASRIADEVLSEWRARGGESEDPTPVLRYLVPIFGLAAVGGVALIALVVWLVLKVV